MQTSEYTATEERPYVPPASVGSEVRATGSLLRDLTREATTLFRQEVALAKQEMSEKISLATRNVAYIAAGGVAAWVGAIFLCLAATAGLYAGLNNVMPWYHALWLSPLIVGGVIAIVGLIMIQKGRSTLKNERMVPEKTMETMRENKQWLKREVR